MFMRKSTHRRLIKEQGESYRWQINEQQNEINSLKSSLTRYFDFLTPTLHTENPTIPYNIWRLIIEIDARVLREKLPQELLVMLRDRILERLMDFNKDYRPDLREQPKNAKLLIR
jgi:hypothetical protein